MLTATIHVQSTLHSPSTQTHHHKNSTRPVSRTTYRTEADLSAISSPPLPRPWRGQEYEHSTARRPLGPSPVVYGTDTQQYRPFKQGNALAVFFAQVGRPGRQDANSASKKRYTGLLERFLIKEKASMNEHFRHKTVSHPRVTRKRHKSSYTIGTLPCFRRSSL